ncbi:MAG: adenylosuccinate synthase [Planctomycetia bacterium 21-64-5]|nr:MAG: adenylosuccinate synthase [Planctomycetia bacterium 21-64-5]HQU45803.1 adenylosuccinate synthase [Pirellulales bacterium]
MPGTCVIGLQWGDEAKGKIVDLLTEDHDVVVRYQGGANAGHTVVTGGQTYKLSLIPSGILRPDVQCVITGGVVLNPPSILSEIDGLRARGIEVGTNLVISDRAHVIFPWHLVEDRLTEGSARNGEAIGTTMRGIGPCYRDKVGRTDAIRLGDLYRASLRERIEHVVAHKNMMIAAMACDATAEVERLDAAQIHAEYQGYAERLKPHVADTTALLLDALEDGERVLFEGAQGALLDVDHGTFPYVTSSNSSGVGIASGSGVPGRYLNKIIGVVKAYGTRVGGGPFPTEQDNALGQHIRDRGNEYGTVTRRPRRCGWFDAVAVRYTARLSGVDTLAVMLLDVLSELDEIKVCTAYRVGGRRVSVFPSHVEDLRQAEAVYETLPGWKQEISEARSMADLPDNARKYLAFLSKVIGRPVEIVSVGPDREQTVLADPRSTTSGERLYQPQS